jgi:hypothetical protein
MSANAHFINTSMVLNALSTILSDLQGLYANGQWTVDTSQPVNSPAFGSVKIFDADDLVEAFKWLTITPQRVCVIVPLAEQFQEESINIKMIVRRIFPVALMISDRVMGDRTAALLGNGQTPGAMGLKDLVLPAVTGQLVPNPSGVVCVPKRAYVMSVKKKDLPNRIAYCVELECRGGRMDANVSPVF